MKILNVSASGDDGIAELDKVGYDHVDVTHDVYKRINPNIKSKGKKRLVLKLLICTTGWVKINYP